MNWTPPQKPAELAESRLIVAILDGHFPIGKNLPAERELAAQLGVTRPTLREALQRMARDGWIEIQHGRPTRVRNYWQEGNLGVLSALAHYPEHAPDNFVANLLAIRHLLAPTYTRLAVENDPSGLVGLLQELVNTPDTAEDFAAADWRLHHRLTVLSGNPIFTLILNGFEALYPPMARLYFHFAEARSHSRNFYRNLLAQAEAKNPAAAEALTRQIMMESLAQWQQIKQANMKLEAVK
ncbi:MAG: fatty acid metabolism transcriptional regulator FadR [Candidatus Promineifilaceae bacterium]